MHDSAPRLLVVAHGTSSAVGRATVEVLVDAVAAARPEITVDLCFLDVIEPSLARSLDERPTVVVPALLSTGYHVQSDIPAAVVPFPQTRVARHLGPHALVEQALADRLTEATRGQADSTVLVGAGSSRAEAAEELAAAAVGLGARLGQEVTVLTMADDLGAAFAERRPGFRVATYLLCEGYFLDRLTRAVEGSAGVAAGPLGAHPALVDLVWLRYDDARAEAADAADQAPPRVR